MSYSDDFVRWLGLFLMILIGFLFYCCSVTVWCFIVSGFALNFIILYFPPCFLLVCFVRIVAPVSSCWLKFRVVFAVSFANSTCDLFSANSGSSTSFVGYLLVHWYVCLDFPSCLLWLGFFLFFSTFVFPFLLFIRLNLFVPFPLFLSSVSWFIWLWYSPVLILLIRVVLCWDPSIP